MAKEKTEKSGAPEKTTWFLEHQLSGELDEVAFTQRKSVIVESRGQKEFVKATAIGCRLLNGNMQVCVEYGTKDSRSTRWILLGLLEEWNNLKINLSVSLGKQLEKKSKKIEKVKEEATRTTSKIRKVFGSKRDSGK